MTNDAPSQNGPTGNTSPSLIVGLRAKDEQAWQRFLHLYGGLIYTWCRRSNLSKEDAADILQEVAATVDRNISGFRREAAGDTFRGWLRMITRNKIRDTFRAKKGDIGAVGGTKMQLRLAHLESPSDEEDAADRKGAALRALELAHDEFEQKTPRHIGKSRLWDLTQAKPETLMTLRTHRGKVEEVAFSPDGNRLYSAGSDGRIFLHDITHVELARLSRGPFLVSTGYEPARIPDSQIFRTMTSFDRWNLGTKK